MMLINIPYEIGDKIRSETGEEATIISLHVYVGQNGDVLNIRAHTHEAGYVVLEKSRRGGKMEKKECAMTDNDIIKALEHCVIKGDCADCMYNEARCLDLSQEALDLINRQKAEIEALKYINSNYDAEADAIRNIAIKEFAEKVKEELTTGRGVMRISLFDIIDNLVKEMTEGENGSDFEV